MTDTCGRVNAVRASSCSFTGCSTTANRLNVSTATSTWARSLFNGAEYADTYFDVNVEASATTPYSESLNISLLGEFLTAGYIDFTTYLELLPAQIATFKDSLKKRLTESQSAQLKNAEEMLQQYQTYLEQMQKQLQAQGQSLDNVDSIIRKNRQLQELLASLQTEYAAKIQQANQLLTAQATKNAETQADAETMATMLAMEGKTCRTAAEHKYPARGESAKEVLHGRGSKSSGTK